MPSIHRNIFNVLIVVVAGVASISAACAQNHFNTRLFYVKPVLFHSHSQVTGLNLSSLDVSVALPDDHRDQFYGEPVYKNISVHPVDEFFHSSTMMEIQNKIQADVHAFSSVRGRPHTGHRDRLMIRTAVEVFYPKITGFIHGKSMAKVRLALIATFNDSLLIQNTYEELYITDGTDKEFEGDVLMTVEDGTNTTIGMTLRKVLDQFYTDLKTGLLRHDNRFVIVGRATNEKTGAPVAARISFRADSANAVTAAADGRYRLTVPFSHRVSLQVSADGYVTKTEPLEAGETLRLIERNFKLQPIRVGTVVNLKNVLFYMGTTDLLEASYHELDGVVAFLKSNPKVRIALEGHTDNQGDAGRDLKLSQDRVEKIKSYLVSKGISNRRIAGKGFGGVRPIASNETEAGRKLNRRVEFVILKN